MAENDVSQTEQLRRAVADCYGRERQIVQEINALSAEATEMPPLELPRGVGRGEARRARREHKEKWRKDPGEAGKKIAALEAERRASVERRRKLQAGLAGLVGLENRRRDRRGPGRTVQAAIGEALAALGGPGAGEKPDPKGKGGVK